MLKDFLKKCNQRLLSMQPEVTIPLVRNYLGANKMNEQEQYEQWLSEQAETEEVEDMEICEGVPF